MRVNQGKSEGSNFFFGGSAYEQAADGSETRNLHRMEDAILSIIELEAEINGDICKLVQTKKDIVHKIKAVQNTEYQTLLELRYLCFKSWEQIAVDMGYELRWLYRLHHRALDAVSEISH